MICQHSGRSPNIHWYNIFQFVRHLQYHLQLMLRPWIKSDFFKPNLKCSILNSSINFSKVLYTSLSTFFENTGSIETCLKLLTFIEFPDLNKGLTLASSMPSGKTPCIKQILQISKRGCNMMEDDDLMCWASSSSYPTALCFKHLQWFLWWNSFQKYWIHNLGFQVPGRGNGWLRYAIG